MLGFHRGHKLKRGVTRVWKNTTDKFGWFVIILHWWVAVLIVSLFVMGLWMRELEYYDSWYYRAPQLHKEAGLFVLLLLVSRMAWRVLDPSPRLVPTIKHWERIASRIAHRTLLLLTLITILSGYLMVTAADAGVSFLGLFEIPPLSMRIENQEDLAGQVHEIAAWAVILLTGLHGCAALKHHFWDKDATLRRMLGM